MKECTAILQKQAERIAASAADLLDQDWLSGDLASIVVQLAENVPTEQRVDTSLLRERGADDETIARLLRAVEAESIEMFRNYNQDPKFAEYVLKLRQCVRKSIIRNPVSQEDFDFFQELFEGPSPEAPARFQRLHAFMQGVCHSISELVYVHDHHGNLLFMNNRGLSITKFTREDLRSGLSIYDFIAPDSVSIIQERLDLMGAGEFSPFTIEIFTKVGERVPLELATHPFLVGDTPIGIIGAARDRRVERKLELHIHQAEQCHQLLMNFTPLGIVISDAKLIVQDINPAMEALCGIPDKQSLIGKPVYCMGEQEDAALREALTRILDQSPSKPHDSKTIVHFQQPCAGEAAVTPLYGENKEVVGLFIAFCQETPAESLQRNQFQEEKLRALGQIVAGVSHELNNPLTGITGYTQLLLTEDLPPALRTRVDHIAQEASRCQRVVQNLIYFSRTQTPHKRMDDINSILRNAIALREYQLLTDGIELNVHLAPDLPAVQVDGNALQNVFLNLINNAHQALLHVPNSQRRLDISTHARGETLYIRFKDSGPGIPQDAQDQLFDPFFTTKDLGEGIGLGLSVAYGIVQEHGGYIGVQSAPEEGASFTIVLPVREPAKEAEPVAPASS